MYRCAARPVNHSAALDFWGAAITIPNSARLKNKLFIMLIKHGRSVDGSQILDAKAMSYCAPRLFSAAKKANAKLACRA
jgi:hypothetical protein